jgi:hypothetical protein
MTREEEVQYEQDNLGNERKKLDTIRAKEGMEGADDDNEGLYAIGSADTSSDVVVYELPQHADKAWIDHIRAYNGDSVDGTFRVKEATLDSGGSITDTTRRSTPIPVSSSSSTSEDYAGSAFTDSIAVNADFEGEIGVAVVADHDESSETNLQR